MSGVRYRLAPGLLLAAIVAVAAGLFAQRAGILDRVEQSTVSARFEVRGEQQAREVLVVGIDDRTFSDLARRWPFPRSLHGQAVTELRRLGAREIVYDVQFTEPTTDRQDGALWDALARAGGAVLGTSESDEQGRTNVLGGDDNLAAASSQAAAANLPAGPGGVLDHFPYANGRLRSLAVVTAARAGGRPLPPAAFEDGGAWIDFRGPPGTIASVSFSSLIRGAVDPRLVRGRIVVVGATAASLQDVHPTPTDPEPMSGAEVQANAVWSALQGLPLRDAHRTVDVGLLVLLALAIPLLRLRLRVLPTALASPLVGAAYLLVAQVAFNRGTVVWVSAPLLSLAVGTVTMLVASHLSVSASRRRAAADNDRLQDSVRVAAVDNDRLEASVRERTAELRETQLEILQRLSHAAEWRDQLTGLHVARMGRLSHRLALAAGLEPPAAEELGNAAVAHDIGKIAIANTILHKPGGLTPEERREMERHVLIGASILEGSRSPVMQLAETIARTHHEHWDGTGYPNGLSGEDIPLAGRICGICDVFDALVSERPYKRAWSLDEALQEIDAQRGRHFDPDLAQLFLHLAPIAYAELYAPPTGPELSENPLKIEKAPQASGAF